MRYIKEISRPDPKAVIEIVIDAAADDAIRRWAMRRLAVYNRMNKAEKDTVLAVAAWHTSMWYSDIRNHGRLQGAFFMSALFIIITIMRYFLT